MLWAHAYEHFVCCREWLPGSLESAWLPKGTEHRFSAGFSDRDLRCLGPPTDQRDAERHQITEQHHGGDLNKLILFLDFDGVLHPEGLQAGERDQLFCAKPVLLQILRAAPYVDVVFSTSWRLLYSFDDLVSFAIDSGDFAHRFKGITPHLPAEERRQGVLGQREEEIQAWLAMHGRDYGRWLALDDQPKLFRPNCSDLYLIDWQTGLVDHDVWGIVESLR